MEKKKLVDDKSCILVEFEDKNIAVGFKCWLDGFYNEEQIDSAIKDSKLVDITWPKSNKIHPSKKMRLEMKKMNDNDWHSSKVKVLDAGEWCKMFESLQTIEKSNRANKNKLPNDSNEKEVIDNGQIQTTLGNNKQSKKPKEIDEAIDTITENGKDSNEIEAPNKKKKKKKRKHSENEDPILLATKDTEDMVDLTDTNIKKKKKKKRRRSRDEEEDFESPETANENGEHSNDMKVSKKKRKKSGRQSEDVNEIVFTENHEGTNFAKDAEKVTSEEKKSSSGSKEDGEDNASDAFDNAKDLQKESDNQERQLENNLQLLNKNTNTFSTTGVTKIKQKSDRKLKEAAKKAQSLAAADSVLTGMKSRGRIKALSESDETESISSEESPRKRTKAQLQSDVSYLQLENKNLKKELFSYRNNDNTLEKSKSLLATLKDCEKTVKNMSIICQNCKKSQVLHNMVDFETQSFSDQGVGFSQSSVNQKIQSTFQTTYTSHLNERTEAAKISKPTELSTQNQRKCESYSRLKDYNFDLQSLDEIVDEYSIHGDPKEPDNNQQTLDTGLKISKEPMTDIGNGVEIPTAVIKNFRDRNVRHFMLDMINSVFTSTEFANSTKSGRLSRGQTVKDKQPLDPNKQDAIAKYTQSRFPLENIDKLKEELSKMLTNKCKNVASKLKMKNKEQDVDNKEANQKSSTEEPKNTEENTTN